MKQRLLLMAAACAVVAMVALPGGGCRPRAVGSQVAGDTSPADGSPAAAPAEQAARSPQAASAADWPPDRAWANWRGPGGLGIAFHAKLPRDWPSKVMQPIWRYKLGTGWSSPVVAGQRVFVTDRVGPTERLLAVSADSGKPLWHVSNPVDFEPHPVGRRHGNGPKSTPVVYDGKVYSLGIAGWLQCVEARSGRVVWKMLLPKRFGKSQPLPGGKAHVNGTQNVIVPIGPGLGAPVPLFGYTGSPTVDGQRLILEVGGTQGGTVMAFDRTNGRPLWSALNESVSYSSPIVADLAGIRQVIVMTGPRVVGLRVDDGTLLWDHPFQIQYNESISTPTVAGDLVLVTGDSRPLTALRIINRGDHWAQEVAWENDDLSSYLSSMVVAGKHVFGMNDDGQFVCIRLSDGKTVWLDGNHGFYCSPVLAGDRLLGLNETGELAILKVDTHRYHEPAVVEVANTPTWTVPAVIGRRMYLRSREGLRAFKLPR